MKKVAVFFADGFEEVEALTVVDYLRRADIKVDMISTTHSIVCKGAHNIDVSMDISFSDILLDYDACIFPGGSENAKSMRKNEKLLELIKSSFEKGKLIAAICASPTVLYEAGILYGKNVTSYPGVFKENESGFNYKEDNVVIDGNIITSRGPALTVFFALEIIQYLVSKEKRQEIQKQILLDLM